MNYFVIWLVGAHMTTATPCQPEALLAPQYLGMAIHGVVQTELCQSLAWPAFPWELGQDAPKCGLECPHCAAFTSSTDSKSEL